MKYFGLFVVVLIVSACGTKRDYAFNKYNELELFFREWRAFEVPPSYRGAPDYRKQTFDERYPVFEELKLKLMAFDTSGWKIEHKIDFELVLAEMNGFDFNQKVLRPWERDPAFYKTVWTYRSDVPAHEGPTHHALIELWQYKFPLSEKDTKKLIEQLKVIPSLNEQAKINLVGKARDLWIAGIKDIKTQAKDLILIFDKEGVKDNKELVGAINKAVESSISLREWLEAGAEYKTKPSGIGKDAYSWYNKNVRLVPYTWYDEEMIYQRELARAWSSLKLLEHKNRALPELKDARSPKEYVELVNKSVQSYLEFLEMDSVVKVEAYFDSVLRRHTGDFAVPEERNFFWIITHIDPRPLYSHSYHWFELERMEKEPHESIIRRDPLLYNIFDSRNEGLATAVEEMFMQAGMFDDDPRVKELVYILIAQRAARGLGSLYAHANEMTMEEAGGMHLEYTPRGWMKTEKELLIFEQHLYLRQPGYGTSYLVGKFMLEDAMMEYAKLKEEQGKEFKVKQFFDEVGAIGCIPISLVKKELLASDK